MLVDLWSGGTRRGRQSATSSSTSSPSPAPAATATPVGAAPQPQQQSSQPQQLPPTVQTPSSVAPLSPPVPTPKEDHLPAASSPGGTAVPSLSTAENAAVTTGGPPTPGGGSSNSGEKKPGGKSSAQPSPYCDFCLGDARENKKTGGSEELMSCSDCGRSGKPEEKIKRKYTRRANHN